MFRAEHSVMVGSGAGMTRETSSKNFIQFPDTLRNQVLTALTACDLAALRNHLRPVQLTDGQVLYDAGETVEWVYFPETSLIALLTSMRSGRDVANTVRGRDGAVGYVEAIGSGRAFSRAVVQIAGDALRMPAARFREIYDASASLREFTNRRIEILLADTRQAVACQAVHSATQRLARVLLECHDHTGAFRLPLTHELICDLTGLGRTTISQSSNQLAARGMIEHHRGAITLLDTDRLKAVACECYQALREAREQIALDMAPPTPDIAVGGNGLRH